MSFKPGAGYGDVFSYTGVNVRADGFEVKRISDKVMRLAFGDLIFTRLLTESRDAFGVGRGGTFTVPIFKEWGQPGTVSPLISGTAIGVGTQKTESVSMMMYEYGTGVGFEKIANWWTDVSCQEQLVYTLGNHVSRMINWLHFDIFNSVNRAVETVAAGSYTALLATNITNHNSATFGELGVGGVSFMFDTFKKNVVKPISSRGLYGWVGNCETFRNLKSGSMFQNVQLYKNQQGDKYQILGEFNGFVFIETEEQMSKGTSFPFGGDVGGYGFGMPPTTYFYPDFGQDAGRLYVWKTVWYGGQGALLRDKGTACVCFRSKSDPFSYGGLG